MEQIHANIIIRLGDKAKNIFSLSDWMQVNGERVLALRIADSKLTYETRNGAFDLKQNDVVMVTTEAIKKYISEAQKTTSNNMPNTEDEGDFFSGLAELPHGIAQRSAAIPDGRTQTLHGYIVQYH